MSKIRIYIEQERIKELVNVTDRGGVHKLCDVLRLKENDLIYVFDGKGKEYLYNIRNIDKRSVLIEKIKKEREEGPSTVKVVLGFPLMREDKIDFILTKATELGVDGFIPFISSRSLSAKPKETKLRRWHRIVIEAVRQCGRLWIPEISNVLEFDEVLRREFSLKLAASVNGMSPQEVLGVSKNIKDILVVVGPEGDFSFAEYEKLKSAGFKFLRLSENILRAETAAMFAIGVIKLWLVNSE